MTQSIFKTVKTSVKNWWVHLLIGILFVIMGFWVMFTPLASYIGLSIFFSVIIFISGLVEIIFAVSNRDQIDGWGWFLAAAIFDFLFGIILISYPGITITILPILLAFWLMFKGFSAIGTSIDLKHYKVSAWGWLLFVGIACILFAVLIIANPLIGGLSIVYMTAFAFISIGIFRIMLSLKLRKMHQLFGQK